MAIAYRGKGNIYLNITGRCPSDCGFCLAKFTDTVFGSDLTLEHEPGTSEILAELERAFLDGPAAAVVFAGLGEPTMRLDEVLEITEWLKLRRIPSRLNTNGLSALINPGRDVPGELARAGLDAVSVSLVAHNSEVYNQICRPIYTKAYREVLRFSERCIAEGIDTELTVVELPEVDLGACRSIADRMGADFRVRPLITPGMREQVE